MPGNRGYGQWHSYLPVHLLYGIMDRAEKQPVHSVPEALRPGTLEHGGGDSMTGIGRSCLEPNTADGEMAVPLAIDLRAA
jgi:hypothetical protein